MHTVEIHFNSIVVHAFLKISNYIINWYIHVHTSIHMHEHGNH